MPRVIVAILCANDKNERCVCVQVIRINSEVSRYEGFEKSVTGMFASGAMGA